MEKYHDEMTVNLRWRVSTLKFFMTAIVRYIELLTPYEGKGNSKINEELSDWSSIVLAVEDKIKEGTGDYDSLDFGLYGKNYGKLYDLLWKYRNYKEQLLKEKQKTIFVEAALEGEEAELADMDRVLAIDVWEKFTRHHALVPNFITAQVQPTTKDPIIKQQITIGHLYGQFAGINNGTMVQNENQGVMQALTELTKIVAEGNIDNDLKQNMLGDIQTIQAQVTKKSPSKGILETSFTGLQVLADIGTIASTVAPHLDKIQHYINSLPIPGVK